MSKPNGDLRLQIAELVFQSGEGHIPSSYSIIDILQVLYQEVLRFDVQDAKWGERDYFVLSKGHGAAALYVALNAAGLLSTETLLTYGKFGSVLGGHPDAVGIDFVEASTGSLGHGFPSAVGIALGLRIKKQQNRVFALLGDGECHEGTVWEAANAAANHELYNLTAIVDWNGSASQLLPLDDLPAKWSAFGWDVLEIDGHDLGAIKAALTAPARDQQPKVILARTIKGKGVSFTEGHGKWHHKVPSQLEMDILRQELLAD